MDSPGSKPSPSVRLVGADRADDRPDGTAPEAASRYLNRELGWLRFNERVLHEAVDDRTPLLERLRFLSIFSSNLDEFFMKRVGGLKRQVAAGVVERSKDGLTPTETLAAIREAVLPLLRRQDETYNRILLPELASKNIELLEWDQMTESERSWVRGYFRREIYASLTPLAVDPGHPFPFISNLSLSLAVALNAPDQSDVLFARVKIPEKLPQWIALPQSGSSDRARHRFVRLMTVVEHNIQDLFPEMHIRGVLPFRVTRNADIDREEEDAEDLLELIEDELRQRRFERAVRLEHGPSPDPWMLRFIVRELEIEPEDVYELDGELDYRGLNVIADLQIPEMSHHPWQPVVPKQLIDRDTDMFGLIRASDVMVHHPYESFNASVERFVRVAAEDPRVVAIKMTVYRTGDDSQLIETLVSAAEAGKQVVCLVELKARFDEHRNIQAARKLEEAGVHVVYGIVGYKTHTKSTLVVRQESDGLRCYAHIGTGNYHAGTARLYTDFGILTARPEATEEIVELFNYLTGRSRKRSYSHLLIAPINMRSSFTELIRTEIKHAQQGKPARIVAQMNSLEDTEICESLYEASNAGVQIDLIVRGFCCLRPGVPGMSENIRVISIIGRFLEHARIFYFRNAASTASRGRFFVGSADWMYRNLNNRIELIAPVVDPAHRQRVWNILEAMLADGRQAWDMHPDGSYVQRSDEGAVGVHEQFMRQAWNQQMGLDSDDEADAPTPSARQDAG